MSAQNSQHQIYESWVAEYTDLLYRLAYRLSGQSSIAEDLVQETFYHAWRSMNKLRDHDRSKAWLCQILRFRYSHWVRDKTRRIRTTAMSDGFDNMHASNEDSPLKCLANEELLQTALDQLENHYKLPLLLVYLEGHTCQQAADELNLPLGTVLSRLHRARAMLREIFKKLSGDVDADDNTNAEANASDTEADDGVCEDEKEEQDPPRYKLRG